METAWKIAIPVVTVAAAAGAAGFSGYRMMEGFLRRHEPYADDPPADEEYTTPSYHKAYLDGLKYNDAIKAEDKDTLASLLDKAHQVKKALGE